MKLVLATTNPHKLTEIQAILTGLPIQIDILDRRLGISTPEETGQTFADNARLKVLHYARHFSDLTVAEDSGLEIGALNGAPGLLSSRFNGESYAEKFATIYAKLRARGSPTSAARFVCALAVADGARGNFRDLWHDRRIHFPSTTRDRRFRLRPDLFLSTVRPHAGRGLRRG